MLSWMRGYSRFIITFLLLFSTPVLALSSQSHVASTAIDPDTPQPRQEEGLLLTYDHVLALVDSAENGPSWMR